MSSKILVVDDSPTVQKVVAITLANEGHELFQALNEDELTQKLKGGTFDLVLLDFTISQKKSGYETIKHIQSLSPQTPILLLLGQFDQVDDKVLEKLGVHEKMIKPFDSARFIQRCADLLENAPKKETVSLKIDEVIDGPAPQNETWTVQAPAIQFPEKPVLPKKTPEMVKEPVKEVQSEIESWGVPVPSVIGEATSNNVEFPPVIDESSAVEAHETQLEDIYNLPSSSDLDFPSIGGSDVSPEALTQATLSSRLVPMDDLAPEEGDKSFADEQTERLQLPNDLTENLELEIQNDSAEEFWMTDIDTTEGTEKQEPTVISSAQVDEVVEMAEPIKFEVNKEELIEKVTQAVPSINQEEILNQLREALPAIVEEYVKNYCQKTLEKVAWEVIPDLAENLIRKELRSLADSVPRE